MKKRIFALFASIVLVFAVSIVSTGCTRKDNYIEKYAFSSYYVNHSAITNYSSLEPTIEFLYSDTFFKLYEDGTWKIDEPVLLGFSSTIDAGTYTADGNTYNIVGFEYGMTSVGYKTDTTFTINFKYHNGISYVTAMTLTYVA